MWKPLDDHVGQPEDEHRDEEPRDSEREDREREGQELQHRLDDRRKDPVDERGEDQRPGRPADRDAGEDPRRDGERGGVDGPADEDAEQERHGAIVTLRRLRTGLLLPAMRCARPSAEKLPELRSLIFD